MATVPATAHIESIITLTCCTSYTAVLSPSADVPVGSGGQQLAKVSCHECGSEYMFGVIAKTREESLASEVFEHLTDEEEEKAGIDRTDFEPSELDAAMCVGCDGDVDRTRDYCGGCKEYVCATCRTREPARRARHQADEHWQEPKHAAAATSAATADIEDDGSVIPTDDDDFVAEV
jgi:hypothetical protein